MYGRELRSGEGLVLYTLGRTVGGRSLRTIKRRTKGRSRLRRDPNGSLFVLLCLVCCYLASGRSDRGAAIGPAAVAGVRRCTPHDKASPPSPIRVEIIVHFSHLQLAQIALPVM
jgi:hypothetical protein